MKAQTQSISRRKHYPASKVERTLKNFGGKSKRKNLSTKGAQSVQFYIDEECLLTLYNSWVRPIFLYANACWIDQSISNINNI